MAEKCTKTSSPPSWEMKPNPFASLNHFTVPVATDVLLDSRASRPAYLMPPNAAAPPGHSDRICESASGSVTKETAVLLAVSHAPGHFHRRRRHGEYRPAPPPAQVDSVPPVDEAPQPAQAHWLVPWGRTGRHA